MEIDYYLKGYITMAFDGKIFVERLLESYGKAYNENEKPQQKQLAYDLQIKDRTISNWKKGKCPNGQTLQLIIEKYAPSLDYLFNNTDDNYIFMKRDMLDILKIIMLYDFRQRHSFYAGYDISFDTNENKDGILESTITFKLQNKTQHDYIHDLFNNYSSLQDFLIKMDSEHNPNYISDESYISMIDAILNKAKDCSKIDYSKYFVDENND